MNSIRKMACSTLPLFFSFKLLDNHFPPASIIPTEDFEIPNHKINKCRKIKKTRQVLGRPVCDRGAIPRTLVQLNVVRSRLIILINEEINKANGPDKIVAEKKKKKIVAEKKN